MDNPRLVLGALMSTEIHSTDPFHSPTSQWCVVFDTRTGFAVHIHQFIPSSSSDMLSREELAEQALNEVFLSEIFKVTGNLLSGVVPSREYLAVAYPSEDIQ